MDENQKIEIQNYFGQFLNRMKQEQSIDTLKLLKKTIQGNFLLVIAMWFAGSTVIGMPIVLGIILYRGFCIGYTMASIMTIWGTGKGTLFFMASMLPQNLILIPCIIAMAVSGIKLYQTILKERRKDSIKPAIIKHSIFSFMILILLVIAAFIETYLSSNLVKLFVPYL